MADGFVPMPADSSRGGSGMGGSAYRFGFMGAGASGSESHRRMTAERAYRRRMSQMRCRIVSPFAATLFVIAMSSTATLIGCGCDGPALRAALVPSRAAAAEAGKIGDPAEAARRLYGAWRGRNRSAAEAIAEPRAVNKLFAVRFIEMKFNGCKNNDMIFYCAYHNSELGLSMGLEVEGGASAGYHVRWVTFSSEN